MLKGVGIVQGGRGLINDAGSFATAFKDGDGDGMLQHGFSALLGGVDMASAFAQSCFPAGTPLRTPDGSKSIEEFQVGTETGWGMGTGMGNGDNGEWGHSSFLIN